jgi:TonB family protein
VTLLIALAIRPSIILAAGLLLSARLTNRSAALRHRVLVVTLLGAALVVPLSLTVPEWTVNLPGPAAASAGTLSELAPSVPAAAPLATVSPERPTARSPAPPPRDALVPVVFAWLLGVVVAAASLAAGLVRVRRLARNANRVFDEDWLEVLGRVAARYRITRPITLARTESADLLATWGVRRPYVLLPSHSRDWTPNRIHVVLSHELAHIRRHDWVVQMSAECLRALLWFNPLVWMVCTRLRRESEQACDDEVLGIGVGGGDYAAHLLDLARQCRHRGSRWTPVLPMAHPSTLERRIIAMLNPRLDRHSPSWRVLAALCALLLLVTVPIASLRARQAGPALFSGTVYDVTGAVMPGVRVKLVDANQLEASSTTVATGRFEFPVVSPGKYVLDVAVPGFRPLRQEVELRDARDWDRNITLQVGDLRETIIVTAANAGGAPARSEAPMAVRVGGNVRPPVKIKDVRPSYPASMAEAGLSGLVPLDAVIGRDGTVSVVRVLSAQVHPDFALAAADAVRQWRFRPTLLNGQPVDVVMTVSVRFDLQQ